MSQLKTATNGSPDERDADVSWVQFGRTVAFRLCTALGGHLTTDVIWTERRFIFPAFDRVFRGAQFALLLVIAWSVLQIAGHLAAIAENVHLLVLRGGPR